MRLNDESDLFLWALPYAAISRASALPTISQIMHGKNRSAYYEREKKCICYKVL